MRVLRTFAAFCLALLLHAAVAKAILDAIPEEPFAAQGAGEAGMEIGLGLAGSYVDSVAQPAPAQPAPVESKPEPEKTTAVPPAPLPEPEPELEKAEPVEETVQAVVEQDNNAATLLAAKDEEREPASEPAPEHAPAPQAAATAEEEPAAATAALQRATGASSDRTAGGKQGNSQSYFAELMAWLNKHKRYPREAKKEKQQGIVELQFTLLRDGTVINSNIKKSSGYKLLDESALKMLQDAAPLPALPDSMDRQQITLVIPIEFSLITNNRYKE